MENKNMQQVTVQNCMWLLSTRICSFHSCSSFLGRPGFGHKAESQTRLGDCQALIWDVWSLSTLGGGSPRESRIAGASPRVRQRTIAYRKVFLGFYWLEDGQHQHVIVNGWKIEQVIAIREKRNHQSPANVNKIKGQNQDQNYSREKLLKPSASALVSYPSFYLPLISNLTRFGNVV